MACNRLALAFAAGLLALVTTSGPRLTGDAIEYVTMATHAAQFRETTLDVAEARALDLNVSRLMNRNGRQELWHFWVFPVLASPLVAAMSALGRSPVIGFTLFNLALMIWACRRTCARFGAWPAVLVFVSPILWWIDKAQVEVFTVTLMAAALTYSNRLSIAALCCAVAATQNPPLAVGAGYAAWRACRSGGELRGPRWAWGASAIVLVLHPAYYLVELGRATPLVSDGVLLPSARLLFSPLIDPNMGLLWTAPLFAVAAVTAAVVAWPAARSAVLASFAGVLVLLLSFAQAANVNSGGTPGLIRYALWLLPLALPGAAAAQRSATVKGLIVASAIGSVVCFRPSLPEAYLWPSAVAAAVWTAHPGWDNPPAEVFAERMRHQDGAHTLVATAGCEKVLIADGEWPTGCPAMAVPPACATGLCYANKRADGSFAFVQTARRPGFRLSF